MLLEELIKKGAHSLPRFVALSVGAMEGDKEKG
jgi:hypothetical protein